ncbi:MAG: TetR/AcrR family transcriptional regulator [Cellulosilyticum sp.]|nr:TetR/AcrR family transcriptional regulator [Cellulosilyticum sp.]
MHNLSSTDITKQNIIDAFWKLYSKGGMSHVSVTKLCKLAGYNRSTFYAYFQDVYDVLETIENQVLPPDVFMENLLLPIAHLENRSLLLKQLITFFDCYVPYLPILVGENGDPNFRHKFLQKIKPLIQHQLPHNYHSSKQLDYILEYQNTAILSVITKWYQNKKDIPEDELIDLLLNLTTHGTRNILFNPESI